MLQFDGGFNWNFAKGQDERNRYGKSLFDGTPWHHDQPKDGMQGTRESACCLGLED